jgi:hypothetical protein
VLQLGQVILVDISLGNLLSGSYEVRIYPQWLNIQKKRNFIVKVFPLTIKLFGMKKIYFLLFLICLSQLGIAQYWPYIETVGIPATVPVSVANYSGWSNQALTYSGNAVVDTANPSAVYYNNTNIASGGGNVLFTNVPGTYLQTSGFPLFPGVGPANVYVQFELYDTNYTTTNELELSVSMDSGATWSALPYYKDILSPWSYCISDIIYLVDTSAPPTASGAYSYLDASKIFFRFTQTSATKAFRIDDFWFTGTFLLEIKLKSFTASVDKEKTNLGWTAVSSSNKEFFILEKSGNGKDFSTLQKQFAKGDGEFSYEYTDNRNDNTAFYRLKMVALNGETTYSRTVMVDGKASKQFVLSMYPIPSKDVVHLKINSNREQKISLSLTDIKGSIAIEKDFTALEGVNDCELNVQNALPGTYFLSITDGKNKEMRKIVISRQ